MSLGIPLVQKQGICEHPHTFHSHTTNIGETLKEKGTSFLKGVKYSLSWVTDLSTQLTPAKLNTISLIQRGLGEGGAIETLLSGEATLNNAQKKITDLSKKAKDWNSSALSTQSFAKEVLTTACDAVKKTDDFLWAFDAFGIKESTATNTLHGVGYVATAIMSIKGLIGARKDVEKVQDNPTLVKIKKTKFVLNALVALGGLLSLLFTSTKLTITYLAVSSLALGANLADYVMSNRNDPYRLEREAIAKQQKPPMLVMRV